MNVPRRPWLIHLLFVTLLLPGWISAAEPADGVQVANDRIPANVEAPRREAVSKVTPSPGSELRTMADRLASQYGLDRDLVQALIRAESAYDPQAVSPAGAIGLMQVMPETAADYGVGSSERLFDPETNLHTGMRHLKRLIDKYGHAGPAVMAYNAGEGALERSSGFVTYPETQRYTHQVLTDYLAKKGIAPYSEQARAQLGITLTPAMAHAGGTGGWSRPRRVANTPTLDSRWHPTVRRPELDTRLSSQLADNRRRLSSRLLSTTPLKVASLRMKPPAYSAQPGRLLGTRRD